MGERRFHDELYGDEAARIFSSPLYRRLLDVHVALLREVTPGLAAARILSVGCGDGRRELAMARYAGHIVGIDLSAVAVEKGRERARERGLRNVELHAGDAGDLEQRFGAGFDAVWCAGVLHHLSDARIAALLRSVRALLVPGGQLVSMDPNAQRAVNLFKPLFRRAYARYHSPDERELRPRDVVAKLQAAGFEDVEIRFTDWFISPLAWLFPNLPASAVPLLAHLDQLLVRTPMVNRLASGFAALARTPTRV